MHLLLLLVAVEIRSAYSAENEHFASSPCEGLKNYHYLFAQPEVHLNLNHVAKCQYSCQNNTIPRQIYCRGDYIVCQSSISKNQIVNATCILQETLSIPHFDCVFTNIDGIFLLPASYGLELERHKDRKHCVLNGSYRVWYTMDFIRQDWLILLGISLGVGSMALIGLVIFSCCLCWNRRSPKEERFIYSESPRST